jgi:hypothetical protein
MSPAGSPADVSKPIRRWLAPTPDRLVIGLLIVEGLLWLSERFQWFPFNQHKGYTVLVTVATVAAAILFMVLWCVASFLLHWRFQFSICSLLVLAVAVAVPCSWLSWEMKQAKRQKAAYDVIGKWGASYDAYGPSPPNSPAPKWLQDMLGEDFQ